jgi:small-conductance mechanosensitive channel
MKKTTSRQQRKTKSFNPNRQFVDDAVRNYLEKGGKITRVEVVVDDEMERLMANP